MSRTKLQLVRGVHLVARQGVLLSNRQLKASQLTMLNVPRWGQRLIRRFMEKAPRLAHVLLLTHRVGSVRTTACHSVRSPTQAGFRPKLGTVHQAFALQHIVDKQKHSQQPVNLCFVDLKARSNGT